MGSKNGVNEALNKVLEVKLLTMQWIVLDWNTVWDLLNKIMRNTKGEKGIYF